MLNIIKSCIYEICSYFVPSSNPYRRVGSCNMCGKCCREIYSLDMYTEKEFKFMQWIYPAYRRFYIKDKTPDGLFVFACKYVQADGKCSVYKKRPLMCKKYPVPRVNCSLTLPDGCGYKFVKKEFSEFLNQDNKGC